MSEDIPLDALKILYERYAYHLRGIDKTKERFGIKKAIDQLGPVLAADMVTEQLLDLVASAAVNSPNKEAIVSAWHAKCAGCEFLEGAVQRAYGYLGVLLVSPQNHDG